MNQLKTIYSRAKNSLIVIKWRMHENENSLTEISSGYPCTLIALVFFKKEVLGFLTKEQPFNVWKRNVSFYILNNTWTFKIKAASLRTRYMSCGNVVFNWILHTVQLLRACFIYSAWCVVQTSVEGGQMMLVKLEVRSSHHQPFAGLLSWLDPGFAELL